MKSQISPKQGFRAGIGWAPWLLIAVGVATYSNNVDGPFVFDDLPAIVNNASIRQLWPIGGILFAPNSSAEGRPVGNLTLAVNYALSGLDVRSYHVFNIAIHILCALVLFGIVRRTLLGAKLRERFGRASRGLALVCAMIWMVHPIQTECVNYITQRFETIMGLFYLLTLYCAIRSIDSQQHRAWYGASVLSCALGMASKEVMVTAPVMALLYDRVFTFGSITQALRKRWGLYVGLASTWMVLVTLMVAFPQSETEGFHLGVGPWDYAKNQCIVIVTYLKTVVWPHPLILDYGEARPVPLATAAPFAAVVASLLIATIVAFVRWPMVGFLGAWFFVILSPTSSFVPLVTEVGAERRTYLPLAGLVVLVVMAGYALLERAARCSRRNEATALTWAGDGTWCWVGVFLVVGLVASLSMVSLRRNEEYRSELAILQSVVNARPLNPRAHTNLGVVLAKQGKADEAISHFRRALQIQPDRVEAYNNLGYALQALGRTEEAIRCYRLALHIQPNDADAHNNLAVLLAGRGQLDEAIDHFRQIVQLKPNFAEAHNNLANALLRVGQVNEALDHLREAVRLEPGYLPALENIAWILATCPDAAIRDPDQAIGIAERLAELTRHQDAVILDTLAAAYAAAGHFDRAVGTAQQAIALASAAQANELADQMRSRLELYRQGRPYREPSQPQGPSVH